MANFIPPLQMGQVRVIFSCQQVLKIAVFEAKMILQKQLWQPKLKNFFEWFLDLVRLKIKFSLSLSKRCCFNSEYFRFGIV